MRNRKFESISLQRGVCYEPVFLDRGSCVTMRCANPRRGADAADREYPLDVIVFVATGFRQVGLEAGRRSGESPGYWERRRPRYLFTGLMQCAVRGGGIVHFNKVYVGRANARNKGTCDNKATIYQ